MIKFSKRNVSYCLQNPRYDKKEPAATILETVTPKKQKETNLIGTENETVKSEWTCLKQDRKIGPNFDVGIIFLLEKTITKLPYQ